MSSGWPEIILVIKFALEILRKEHTIKDLQRDHKLNLYEALKMARTEADRKHVDAKNKGPEFMANDTNSMLDDSSDLFFGSDDDTVASRGED